MDILRFLRRKTMPSHPQEEAYSIEGCKANEAEVSKDVEQRSIDLGYHKNNLDSCAQNSVEGDVEIAENIDEKNQETSVSTIIEDAHSCSEINNSLPLENSNETLGESNTETKNEKIDLDDNNPLEGTYIERFFYTGDLNITKDGFYINFYFSGRDRRYSSHTYPIRDYEIDEYITALQKSWNRLMELSDIAKNLNGASLCENGEKFMRLSASGTYRTLYVFVDNFPISSEAAYNEFLTKLKGVTARATYIQNKIFK